jgi:type VI secretion system protein ImpK
MSENPFVEPEDDRTIIRPSPGGRRVGDVRTAQDGRARRGRADPATTEAPPVFQIGSDLLGAIAEPLIVLLARIRIASGNPPAIDLEQRVVQALHLFERRSRDAGIDAAQIRAGSAILCASLDEAVSNTPWGARAGWHASSLATKFHHKTDVSEAVGDILRRSRQEPERWMSVLRLLYLCLSLGLEGRRSATQFHDDRFKDVRREVYEIIKQAKQSADAELSPVWRGVYAPARANGMRIPLWVILSATLATVVGLFMWCTILVNQQSDELFAQFSQAPPSGPPQIIRATTVQALQPVPKPAKVTRVDRFRTQLASLVESGKLTVLGDESNVTFRIGSHSLFPAVSATLQTGGAALLEQVSDAIKRVAADGAGPEQIQINAYTDNQPVRTVKFPSNYKLSAARAEAIRAALVRVIGPGPGITAEGRADADPIDTNTTVSGRDANQRAEIVVQFSVL